ncbi:restriction endonuclease subunit S [Ligilactobacillus salivarius]|uniref:restriction endonuclease subunit S n=1 Tax=Ligilactobacillus salivarius TaxID=1624 RepID=UPI00342F4591
MAKLFFYDIWEQVKLEKIATFSKGKGYSKLDLKRKGYPIFLYGQMYTNYRYKIVETSTYAILKEDAVVSNGNEIVIPSSGETSVDIARASWIAQKGIIIGSDLNIIRPTSSVHPLFLALSLSNNQVKYNLAKVAQGNSIVHLYNNNLKKVNIYFPNIVEQNRIGNILNSISNCINLHERKCEELALIKKALLQKLFPKKDEIKPEVRYKNFNDAWEQRKLGETSKITAGGDVDKEKLLTHGKYPVIANALTNDGIVGYYNDAYRITAPAVTVTGRGEIGKAKSRKINFTPVVRLLSVESKHNVDFLAEAINRSKVVFESTGVPQLTVPKLSNYKISFPVSENEETKIGDFIQQFDSLIALHQRKLEKLKQLKKFLLQNMFI